MAVRTSNQRVRRPGKKVQRIRKGKRNAKRKAKSKVKAKPKVKPKVKAKPKAKAKPKVKVKPKAKPQRRKRPSRAAVPRTWKKRLKIPNWKTLTPQELERMTAQIVQRIGEKIVGGQHRLKSVEGKILTALIAAEQRGELNAEFYEQAGKYKNYDSPQDVYQLWLYSGT